VISQAGNKVRLKKVHMIGPAKMAEVPDDLRARAARGPHDRLYRAEIILAWRGFDPMPAHTLAGNPQPLTLQPLVILLGKAIVSRRSNQIQPFAGTAPVS